MHRRNLMYCGSLKDGNVCINIKGGFSGKLSELSIQGQTARKALEHTVKILGRMRGEKQVFSKEDFCEFTKLPLLDRWTRKLGMSFFFWRGHNEQLFTLFIPVISGYSFGVDDLLEELIDVATMMSVSCSCKGATEDLMSYDVARVAENALEVIFLHKKLSVSNVGYVGLGKTLSEAIGGVSTIIPKGR